MSALPRFGRGFGMESLISKECWSTWAWLLINGLLILVLVGSVPGVFGRWR
jgi:hypothetical protein